MRECRTCVMAGKRRPQARRTRVLWWRVERAGGKSGARGERAAPVVSLPGKNACYLNAPPKRLVVSPIGESRAISTNGLMCPESSRPPLPFAPPHSATASCSKGRLIRCTVPGLTPNCLAMTRTPGLPGVARASRIRFSSAGAIGGRPRRLPSPLARARPARTRS